MLNVLIVDDDANVLRQMAEGVSLQGFGVTTARNLDEARVCVAGQRIDMVLLATASPEQEAAGTSAEPGRAHAATLVLTGYENIQVSMRALRQGAVAHPLKPVTINHLQRVLARIAQPTARNGGTARGRGGHLLGTSAALRRIRAQIEQIAPTPTGVLIIGENGAGRKAVARAIHNLSPRREQTFLSIDCGALASADAIPGQSPEAEAGREWTGGTVFLDDITALPAALQGELQRALAEGGRVQLGAQSIAAAEARIIAASNRPLEASGGGLREDLLQQLQLLPIYLPPLRERVEDIEPLAQHFLDDLNERGHSRKTLSAAAKTALRDYPWPGNVRELKNTLQRAYLMADQRIELENLPPELHPVDRARPHFSVAVGSSVAEVERQLILSTLAYCNGAKEKAAKILGLSLKTIYNRLKEYEEAESAAHRQSSE
jgi:DNA-binding NtrC family response regulator